MKRLVALLVVLASACEAAPIVVEPSPSPGRLAAPAGEVWGYSGTLLRPADPSLYENVLDAAVPLRDGGWLVLKQLEPRRVVPRPPGTFGGGLPRTPLAVLLRLDAHGVEIAREHGSEPFGLRDLRVFEDQGLVIGYGAQVLNGSIHAFDLATLDGLWTVHDRDPVPCVKVADRCWTYRRSSAPTDTTALTERDPRTYRALRTFSHLAMDGLQDPPGIYPEINAVVWNAPRAAGLPRGVVRVDRLELDRPPVAWASRVQTACWVHLIGATHLFVRFGDCAPETAGNWELFEVASGRTVRTFRDGEAYLVSGGSLLHSPTGLIDLRDGSAGPALPGPILAFDDARGVAAVRLASGGAAVYQRNTGGARPVAVTAPEIARLSCPGFEFGQVAQPRDADGRCPEVNAHAGPGRLLVTPGRVRGADEFVITGIQADAGTRELTIRSELRGDRLAVPASGVARIIELPDAFRGQWLVRLDRGGDAHLVQTFVVDLPASAATPTPTPATPSASPFPPRAVRANWGDSDTTAADIARRLELAGYSPRYGGTVGGRLLFGADSEEFYDVDEHRVSVLLFADPAKAEEVFQMLAAGRHTVTFFAPAHFVKIGRAVAIVLTRERDAGVPLVQALAN